MSAQTNICECCGVTFLVALPWGVRATRCNKCQDIVVYDTHGVHRTKHLPCRPKWAEPGKGN